MLNVDDELARAVADGIGLWSYLEPLRKRSTRAKPETTMSTARPASLVRPGPDGIATRCVAILVADGVDGTAAHGGTRALAERGAVPRFVGVTLGSVAARRATSSQWKCRSRPRPGDLGRCGAPDGQAAAATLSRADTPVEFLKDQYRNNCKPSQRSARLDRLLDSSRPPRGLPTGGDILMPGIAPHEAGEVRKRGPRVHRRRLRHRHFERETDPPLI